MQLSAFLQKLWHSVSSWLCRSEADFLGYQWGRTLTGW